MDSSDRCLLVRNKPYGKVDMFDLAIKHRCAFLGYPAIAAKAAKTASTLAELVVPFNALKEPWKIYKGGKPTNASKSQEHRNKLCDLMKGESLLLMPRLAEGRVYVGTYAGFTFQERPSWMDEFLERYKLAVPKKMERQTDLIALASVCQTLNVDDWVPVPFVNIPAWIRAKCFGQSGAAWINSIDERSVVEVLNRIRSVDSVCPTDETSDITEVAKRLLDMITPEPLEHLMVALLQLENPKQTWLQVGGSGDGGTDGIGFNPDGSVAGVLQCKWEYDGSTVDVENHAEAPIHLAYLVGPDNFRPSNANVIPYDRFKLAKLVVKYANKLPMATTLKVRSV